MTNYWVPWVTAWMVLIVSTVLYLMFGQPEPQYISVSHAANIRCSAHGGVRSLTQPDFGRGTVVCADGIARTYTTRIK